MADRISIDVILKSEQLKKMMEDVGRMAGAGPGGAAGQAGAAAGGGRGGIGGAVGSAMMGEEGKRTEMMGKGLGQIAKQLPGAGVFGDMAGAFKAGGVVGVGMAGIAGILGFVKQIVESSKVFQGIAGSFFKIFGAMADVFLLPFLPLAMKGMQMLLKNMPMIAEWGDKAAGWLENLIANIKGNGWINAIWVEIGPPLMSGLSEMLSVLPGVKRRGWEAVGEPGQETVVEKSDEQMKQEEELRKRTEEKATMFQNFTLQGGGASTGVIRGIVNEVLRAEAQYVRGVDPRTAYQFENKSSGPGADRMWAKDSMYAGETVPISDAARQHRQLGGFVHGGPGEGVPTMLHGGEIVIPRSNVNSLRGINSGVLDILAGTDGQLQALEADVNNYWLEAKRDRQDPQSDFMKFKLEVLGEDLPNTLSGIGGFYSDIGDMARNIAAQTKGFGAGWTAAGLAAFNKYGVAPMTPREIAEGVGDNDTLDPNRIEDGWSPFNPNNKFKSVVANPDGSKEITLHDGKKVTISKHIDIDQVGKKTGTIYDKVPSWGMAPGGGSMGIHATAPGSDIHKVMERDFSIQQVGRTGTIFERPEYQWGMAPGGGSMGIHATASGSRAPTPQEILAAQLLEYQKEMGAGYAQVGEEEGEGQTQADLQQQMKARAEFHAEQQKKIQDKRLAESLRTAQEAIYGPEGGINKEGEFVHGGLLDPETGRMKTLDQVEVNQATFAMTELEAPEATAAPRVDAETAALEAMIGAQVQRIKAYQPRITAAWQLSNQGLEGGRGQPQRGTAAQALIRERSQQEERLTRMWNQHGQDRLPYSLQEFQTRFQSGGIVPGDIGEPQMVVAHGGETISPVGMTGGRRGHTSNRVMNISINNASSVRDILRDLNDMESMDDASFFNSVS